MIITKQQEDNLTQIDVSGKGGKDAEIATAMGFQRKSEKYYDAVDPSGNKWEFKKQQSQQWIDPYKLAQLTKQEKNIGILFFMHKDGEIVEIYETNYKELIKAMGYTARDLYSIRRLYQKKCLSERATQMKSELKYSEISKFKKIWEKNV